MGATGRDFNGVCHLVVNQKACQYPCRASLLYRILYCILYLFPNFMLNNVLRKTSVLKLEAYPEASSDNSSFLVTEFK